MTNKINDKTNPKDSFWAIRPTFKAFIIRGTELLLLTLYSYISQFLIPKENVSFEFEKNLLYGMVIGILIITSFSFIFYKSYDILAERIKKKRQQTWNDAKEMSKHLKDACVYRMKRFYKNLTAK